MARRPRAFTACISYRLYRPLIGITWAHCEDAHPWQKLTPLYKSEAGHVRNMRLLLGACPNPPLDMTLCACNWRVAFMGDNQHLQGPCLDVLGVELYGLGGVRQRAPKVLQPHMRRGSVGPVHSLAGVKLNCPGVAIHSRGEVLVCRSYFTHKGTCALICTWRHCDMHDDRTEIQ